MGLSEAPASFEAQRIPGTVYLIHFLGANSGDIKQGIEALEGIPVLAITDDAESLVVSSSS